MIDPPYERAISVQEWRKIAVTKVGRAIAAEMGVSYDKNSEAFDRYAVVAIDAMPQLADCIIQQLKPTERA